LETIGRELFGVFIGPGVRIDYDPGARLLRVIREGSWPEEVPFGGVGDWKPNSRSDRLPAERAAELFNLVEDWLLGDWTSHPSLAWRIESARGQIARYDLDLGRGGDVCHICGAPEIVSAYGHIKRPFKWSRPICRVCSDRDMKPSQWDKSLPETAVTPTIHAWRERRPAERG